jgi:outer membrane protein assembly factor BamB
MNRNQKSWLRKASLVGTILFGISGASGLAENWPCFRGPGHQGVSHESRLPLYWNASSNILWKTSVPGEAWSSPIVWNDRVFLTTATEGGVSCRVLSFESKTGRVLWEKEVFKQLTRKKEGRNSYATPTPVTDGEHVYAAFGDGSFVALDFAGNVIWTNRDFPFYSQHGLGTSPVLFEDLLIMSRDASSEEEDKTVGWQKPWEKSFVMAVDRRDGKLRWKTFRGLSRIAHVTPNLWTPPGAATQVISGAGDVVQAFDARSGKLVWSSENNGEGVVPSIVIGENLAFAACGFSGRDSIKAFRLQAEGDEKPGDLAWEQKKGTPKIPSVIYVAPHLFTINEGGIATCLKAATGEVVWQERVGGNFSASPVAADGRIYLFSDGGETVVIEAGPEFKLLARNPLDGKAQASFAVSNGRIFIRTDQSLFCVAATETK